MHEEEMKECFVTARLVLQCDYDFFFFFLAVMIKVTDSPRGVQCLCETDPLKMVDSFVMRS